VKPVAYEGEEKYIFVSYSHEDREQVLRLISSLQLRGYRVWYDEGITPGSEWPEYIASHLDRAAMVMAVMTPNAMKSANCRREIHFALAKQKPFLSVELESTELSLGLEMQLMSLRSVVRSEYADWERFINSIAACPGLDCCNKNWSGVSEPSGTKPSGKGSGKRFGWEGFFSLLIVLAMFAGAAYYIVMSRTTMSWGDRLYKYETNVYISGETVLQEDLEFLASMKNLEELHFENCDFSAAEALDEPLDFLSSGIRLLELSSCQGLSSFEFLGDIRASYLWVENCPELYSLEAFDLSQLGELNISGSSVSSLDELKGTDLWGLYFSNTAVTDVAVLSSLRELKYVSGSGCQIESLEPLSVLEKLEIIDFCGCPLQKVETPFRSAGLRELYLDGCQIDSFAAFSELPGIRVLSLQHNNVLRDMSWLNEQSRSSLRELRIGYTGFGSSELGFLSEYGNLESLWVSGIWLEDLWFCENLSSLKELRAEECSLKRLDGLENCPLLKTAMLRNNYLDAVYPSSLAVGRNKGVLDLSNNRLSGMDAFTGELELLVLTGSGAGADSIAYGLKCDVIVADWTPELESSKLRFMEEDIQRLVVVDCPEEQQQALQEAFPPVEFVDAEGMMQLLSTEFFNGEKYPHYL